MVRQISAWALALDTWLQERLGRPYNALLSVGLVFEIVRHIVEMSEHLRAAEDLERQIIPLVLEIVLLIHQVGALSHRFDARDRLRERRRGGKVENQREAAVSTEGELFPGPPNPTDIRAGD